MHILVIINFTELSTKQDNLNNAVYLRCNHFFLAPNIQLAAPTKKSQENVNIEVCGHIALVVPMCPHAPTRLRKHHPRPLGTSSSPHKTSEQKRNEEKKHHINIRNTLAVFCGVFCVCIYKSSLPKPFFFHLQTLILSQNHHQKHSYIAPDGLFIPNIRLICHV